ncbi:MAG: response regulator [Treponema sp.]|nr:response regulator [Treponema sp.]
MYALEKIKENQYDLIVCDDIMPRMNGEILLDNIRRMDSYIQVPVIAVSNTPIPKADFFISKSDFKRDNLIQKIKELVHE